MYVLRKLFRPTNHRVLLVAAFLLSLTFGMFVGATGAGPVRAAATVLHARVPALTAAPINSPPVSTTATPVATGTITSPIASSSPPTPAPILSVPPIRTIPLTRISSDTLTNPVTATAPAVSSTLGQHASEVEPDVYSFGGTTVVAFQVGRLYDGGSRATGWATRVRGGPWHHGLLPALTKDQTPPGPFDRLSDAVVTYDARHHTWLISSLAVTDRHGRVAQGTVVVSRSSNGVTWTGPYTVSAALPGSPVGFYDKDWITCDNTATSPYYGHCYTQWDRSARHDVLLMSTSRDGGKTWSAPVAPVGTPLGLGGQPVVQPDGTVVVPALGERGVIIAYSSRDGGATWGAAVTVSFQRDHAVAGHMRTEPLPSAAIDGAGTIYVAWQDCRFEFRCAANDIVLSRSTDGVVWSNPVRVPIDPIGSGADHFIPGLGVDKTTAGAHARLALAYYDYPTALCLPATCQLDAGFISSTDSGATWSAPRRLAGPMPLGALAKTSLGAMVGDYIATAFSGGAAIPVLAVAVAVPSHVPGALDEAIYAARISLGTQADAAPRLTGRGRTARGRDHVVLSQGRRRDNSLALLFPRVHQGEFFL